MIDILSDDAMTLRKQIHKLELQLSFSETARRTLQADKQILKRRLNEAQAKVVTQEHCLGQQQHKLDQAKSKLQQQQQGCEQKLTLLLRQDLDGKHRKETMRLTTQLPSERQPRQDADDKLRIAVQEREALLTVKRSWQHRAEQAEMICARLKLQVAALDEHRLHTQDECKELARRVHQQIDERLASSSVNHFDSLHDFPHNLKIAAHYRLVMTEMRMDAVEWLESECGASSPEALMWLELLVQLCLGWVRNHKLRQYEATCHLMCGDADAAAEIASAVASASSTPSAIKATAFSLPSDKTHKAMRRDKLEPAAGASAEVKHATDADDATAATQVAEQQRPETRLVWQSRHDYAETPTAAPLSDVRQWLLVLLRRLHKTHTKLDRLATDGKIIWNELCASIIKKPLPWSTALATYMTGNDFLCSEISARSECMPKHTELLSVCWEVALATPPVDLIMPHKSNYYTQLHRPTATSNTPARLAFPVLAAVDGDVLVKGEVFFA